MQHPHRAPRRLLVTAVAAAALVATGIPPVGAEPAVMAPDPVATASPSAGSFYPVAATRLVGPAGAATGRTLLPGAPLRVPVLGRPGLPTAGVSAVVLNVTTTAAGSRASLLSIRPGRGPLATARPLTSVTAPAGGTRTSLVTVPLDPDGALDVVASSRATVSIDLVGLYAADDTVVATLGATGGYQPSVPVRLVGPGAGQVVAPTAATSTPSPAPTIDPALAAALPADGVRRVALDLGDDTAQHVTALLLRVSVVSSPAAGTVTAAADTRAGTAVGTSSAPSEGAAGSDGLGAPGSVPSPTTSAAAAVPTPSLSLARGVTASNLAVVPAVLDGQGLLRFTVASTLPAAVPVRVDLVGFYDDGSLGADLRFRALPVGRLLDTRSGPDAAPVTAAGGRVVRAPADVVGDNTFGLVGSLTALTPDRATDVAVRRDDPDSAPPRGAGAGDTPVAGRDQVTTPVQVEVGASGRLLLGASTGPVEAVLDVVGSFEAYPAVEDPALREWVHAVPAWQVRALAR